MLGAVQEPLQQFHILAYLVGRATAPLSTIKLHFFCYVESYTATPPPHYPGNHGNYGNAIASRSEAWLSAEETAKLSHSNHLIPQHFMRGWSLLLI